MMSHPEIPSADHQRAMFNSDGELLGDIFVCPNCGDVLIHQGIGLRARLERIKSYAAEREHASTSHSGIDVLGIVLISIFYLVIFPFIRTDHRLSPNDQEGSQGDKSKYPL